VETKKAARLEEGFFSFLPTA